MLPFFFKKKDFFPLFWMAVAMIISLNSMFFLFFSIALPFLFPPFLSLFDVKYLFIYLVYFFEVSFLDNISRSTKLFDIHIDNYILLPIFIFIIIMAIIQTPARILTSVKCQYSQFFLQLLPQHPLKDPLEGSIIE